MIRSSSLCAVAFCVLAASGCGSIQSGGDISRNALKEVSSVALCCPALADASATLVPIEAKVFHIDKQTPVYEFDGHRSPFLFFQLPDYQGRYSLVIRSMQTGKMDEPALFVPRLRFYDQNFQVTRNYDESSMKNRGGNVEITVFMNATNSAERYFAIYTAGASQPVSQTLQVVTQSTISSGAYMFSFISGNDVKATLYPSMFGDVSIERRNE